MGIVVTSVELESQQRQAELDRKSYDDLLRERDILSKVWVVATLSHMWTLVVRLDMAKVLYLH